MERQVLQNDKDSGHRHDAATTPVRPCNNPPTAELFQRVITVSLETIEDRARGCRRSCPY